MHGCRLLRLIPTQPEPLLEGNGGFGLQMPQLTCDNRPIRLRFIDAQSRICAAELDGEIC